VCAEGCNGACRFERGLWGGLARVVAVTGGGGERH